MLDACFCLKKRESPVMDTTFKKSMCASQVDHGDWKPDWNVAAGKGGGGAANALHKGVAVSKL